MFTSPKPESDVRVRLLRRVGLLEAGAVVAVDADTARSWILARLAEGADARRSATFTAPEREVLS